MWNFSSRIELDISYVSETRVRYKLSKTGKIPENFISTSISCIICLLYNYANYEVVDNFPKALRKLSEGHTNVSEHFPNMSADDRRLLETSEEDPKTFRSYINKFNYS